MTYRLLLLALISSTVPAVTVGQISSTSMVSRSTGAVNVRLTIAPPRVLPPEVTGAPYSADMETEHVQTLADGTRITQQRQIEHVYRDSDGRTRTERAMFMAPMAANQNFPKDIPPLVEIMDPVAGVEYVLDSQNHVAHCFTVQAAPRLNRDNAPGGATVMQRRSVTGGVGGGGSAALPAGVPTRHQAQSESLGTQVIEGVVAEGWRTTTTLDAGSVGNDRPIEITNEMWRAPQLNVVVLSKNNDPRNGENTMRLKNINLAEPDPGLFQPPPDYKIVNDTEAVTITYTRP